MKQSLSSLLNIGQSIWYDDLSREVLESGKLASFINDGVRGLTSNPTIFKNAIAGSNDYDKSLEALLAKGLDTEEICEELMLQDVGAAADLLRPIYDESISKKGGSADGYASIEVSPRLAADTAGTLEAARRIWSKLDRPNIMIKVPATPEGVPAIRELLAEGINVNVTLIFSSEVYSEVLEAYISGLEERANAGSDISTVSSVASFFVSRVDSWCEGQASFNKELEGKVGIANSCKAYQHFLDITASSRWQDLAAKGAQVQRPLWASTSTKNPDFDPLLYVKSLAGAHTVNTVPPVTLNALLDAGEIQDQMSEQLVNAPAILESLAACGIDLSAGLLELRDSGVSKFADSYDELLEALSEKVGAMAA